MKIVLFFSQSCLLRMEHSLYWNELYTAETEKNIGVEYFNLCWNIYGYILKMGGIIL